jgi:hypothetical protein
VAQGIGTEFIPKYGKKKIHRWKISTQKEALTSLGIREIQTETTTQEKEKYVSMQRIVYKSSE